MNEQAREAHLTIGFDGERVTGALRDEHGETRPFSGWLDLIALLRGLGPDARPADADLTAEPSAPGPGAAGTAPPPR